MISGSHVLKFHNFSYGSAELRSANGSLIPLESTQVGVSVSRRLTQSAREAKPSRYLGSPNL